MRSNSTTNSWLFPPNSREIQLDEQWSFVFKKQEHCDSDDPAVKNREDYWEQVALDAGSRLVHSLVPGVRNAENVAAVVEDVIQRTRGRVMDLITSDEYLAC